DEPVPSRGDPEQDAQRQRDHEPAAEFAEALAQRLLELARRDELAEGAEDVRGRPDDERVEPWGDELPHGEDEEDRPDPDAPVAEVQASATPARRPARAPPRPCSAVR